MELAEVMAGKYGQHMLGKRYDLLTHAAFWTELAAQQKKPVLQAEQAAALQRVARRAALATGVLSEEDIEKRKGGMTLYPQHVDDDVAFASVRGMIVVCVESPETKSPTIGYFKGWLRVNAVGRAMVDRIAMESGWVGDVARKFLAPALIKENRVADEANAVAATRAESAEWWRKNKPNAGPESEQPAAGAVEEAAYVEPDAQATIENGHIIPGPTSKEWDELAKKAADPANADPKNANSAAGKTSLLFHAGGAHLKDLDVTNGKLFVLVVKETDKSAAEVLEEYDAKPDWDAKVKEAADANVARAYLYERSVNGKEMECVESWPRRAPAGK